MQDFVYFFVSGSDVDGCFQGSINLSEVRGVSPASSLPPGAPKKTDELQTVWRTYSLCGESRAQAAEWMEKIQNCL